MYWDTDLKAEMVLSLGFVFNSLCSRLRQRADQWKAPYMAWHGILF